MAKEKNVSEATEPYKAEVNLFAEKDGFSTHFKLIGDVGLVDDVDQVIAGLIERGYKPGSRGNSNGGAPGASKSGQAGQAGNNRPTSFELDGTRWYINESKKRKGTYYVARKGNGGYEYLPDEEIPDFIKEAYGSALPMKGK